MSRIASLDTSLPLHPTGVSSNWKGKQEEESTEDIHGLKQMNPGTFWFAWLSPQLPQECCDGKT